MRFLLSFIIGLFFCIEALAFPKLTGQVVDEANILNQEIEQLITEGLVKNRTDNIVVVTVKSLNGQSIETYTRDLGNHWGIGDKKRNNGIILLIAPQERLVRIATGLGIEKTLTNKKVDRIIQKDMMPYLKQSDYNRAAIAGVNGILLHKKDYLPWYTYLTGFSFEELVFILILILYIIGATCYIFVAPRGKRLKRFGIVLLFTVTILFILLWHAAKNNKKFSSGGFFGGGGRFGNGGSTGSF